jgi:hypothetical protein
MKRGIETRDPELGRFGMPVWFHHHGHKMKNVRIDDNRHLAIWSHHDIAVEISKVDQQYLVCWKIKHILGWATGTVSYTVDELRSAFGLSEDSGDFGGWLIDRFGADVAEQGKFIRWKDFLNIPCPGTGNDGDPNLSIELSDEIKDAVEELLKNS